MTLKPNTVRTLLKIIVCLVIVNFAACAAYPGTDGRTYYWIKPLPSGDGGGVTMNSAYTVTHTGMVNGRGVSVTSFVPAGRGR